MHTTLTQTQLAIYYESINKPGQPVYIISLALTLEEGTDMERLRQAVAATVRRYPVLTSTIAVDAEGLPVLVEGAPDDWQVPSVEEMSDEELDRLLDRLPEPIELEGGPLFGVRLLSSPGRSVIYLYIHHVVGDGTTVQLIYRSISDAYMGNLPAEKPMTIGLVRAHEEELRNSPRFDEAKNWYRETFSGIETDSLPLPDVLSGGGTASLDTLKLLVATLSTPYRRAYDLSRRLGIPLSVVLDGAFGYLMGVWNGAEESVFSTIFAGRRTDAERSVAGMMVKTIPVYCNWSGDTDVDTYLTSLAAQRKLAKDYSDTYSYAEVCSDTGIRPTLNFSYRGSIQAENIVVPGLFTGSRRLGYYTTGETLQFLVDHVDGALVIRAEYQGVSYTPEFIGSLCEAYDMVLRGFVAGGRLADIELCSESMAGRLEAFNTTSPDALPAGTAVDLFRGHVERCPDRVILRSPGSVITYGRAGAVAEALASYIASLGIGRGDAVGVLIDRNEWMLLASLGVMCSGAAYQPLDAAYPADRINYMMKDADVRLLIADRSIQLPLDEELKGSVKVLYTDEIAALADRDAKKAQRPAPPSQDDGFILLYTSGTTGLPKGVKLTHGNLMALWGTVSRQMPEVLTPADTWGVYASYGFDAAFFSLMMPVCAGAAVSIVPEEARLDMEALNAYYRDTDVTAAFMTTQVGRIFATTVEETSLKVLIVGGEKLVPCAPPRNYRLINIYGPTEGTVYSHHRDVDRLFTRVPIGIHNDSYKNYIVDRHGRRMPLGALGEMLIAGPQVGAGYLNLPEKTASVFVANPFTADPLYARAYHTGDIVRLLPADGEADIIGRNDGQVKVRGFRIELAEVEQVVREFPGVKDATVQAFDDPAGGKFIAAYVVADSLVDVEALNAFIGARKPAYMIPASTMQIEAIPLTRNQKVDRRALPTPTPAAAAVDVAETSRRPNLLEKEIMAIVADVLKVDDVALTIPLAMQGLTSISSIRLAAALYKRFGTRLSGADLVKDATVTTVEDIVLERLLSAGSASAPREESAAGRAPLTSAPLTVSQQGVYADTMRNPGSTAYNIPIYLRFDSSTDAPALADAVGRILDAHPYLRDARLKLGEVDVEQTVVPPVAIDIPVKRMTDEEFEAYKNGFVKPFDLMRAPLCRFEVVETPSAVWLLVDVQHIVFDGSSLTLMLSQLKTLLEGGEIAPETLSYLDYADTEAQWLDGEGGRRAARYFGDMLADCEAASDIPQDRPAGNPPGERGTVSTPVDMERIEAFGRDHGITPAALCMAATCYAVARFTAGRSAYISTISTGRADVRFADTFGMFVKTLPVAMKIGDGSALDYVKEARTLLEGIVENEMYPYARICADYNYAPNVVYEYQYGLVDDLTVNGRRVERRLFDVDTLKFKIAVHVEEVGGKPSIAVHYRRGLYSDALMETFCHSVATVIDRIMDKPGQPVARLSMLTAPQRELLDRFASTAVTEPSDKCFHELMEGVAAQWPDRRAVVAVDRTLTYGELDRLANCVANNLIARGVKPGDKVVLLLSRTSRFFTSLYGVLKAGAAYIPSSPDYPEERKQSIIEDSQAAWVITDENVEELHSGADDSKPQVSVTPDDIVYLIYTSGSTGRPKGVLLRHRGIVNYVTPAPSVIHTHAIVERCSVVGSITTVAFDMALKEWGIALSNGLTVVFADDGRCNDPVALAELFTREGVDYFNTTPSRMQQYMELDDFCTMLSRLRVVICGAEKYPEYLVQRLREVAPQAEIFNTYGPTEITVSSNACNLTRQESVSVGRPLRNYIEHIVDADDNLLPPGVTGELLISGSNIALGYNANPEQTAKAFVTFDGLETYRSGDYARWDAEGNVVILGRKDTQVKLRGLRIELGEIERVMGDIDAISVSHIMIREVAGRENLVAYYTLKPGFATGADEIKALMAEKLTDYMLPSFFVEMEQMPLTPNGKINTRALPEPAVAEREAGSAPVGELECMFVDIYKEILGAGEVYADDSFFAIGGTSLTATRIMIAASKAGHRLIYADIFANPTPRELAALIASREGKRPEVPAPVEIKLPANTAAAGSDGYDYTAINKILADNTLDNFRAGQQRPLGRVLLTGATGFAGIHVLHELLSNYDCHVVCLGRDSRSGVPAAERISQLYFYYFGEPMTETYPGRVTVVKGDITDPASLRELEKLDIQTVFNCAACVKHFSAGTEIEDINYHGVLNLIDLCRHTGALLVQTSTVSVTGRQPATSDAVLDERSLYIGQDFADNKYIISKFMAERAILEAVAAGEIKAKIVRLGNLAPRERDGEFQVNFRTNGFMNRLRSMALVGCYPYSMYSQNKDISPIDDVARAIVLFARTPASAVVFHGNNANRYSLGNFYYEASRAGLPISPVENDEFVAALERAKNDPAKLSALVGLMAYEGMGDGLKPVDYSNDFSSQVLLRMGFHWPVISTEYVGKLVRALDGLGFFTL